MTLPPLSLMRQAGERDGRLVLRQATPVCAPCSWGISIQNRTRKRNDSMYISFSLWLKARYLQLAWAARHLASSSRSVAHSVGCGCREHQRNPASAAQAAGLDRAPVPSSHGQTAGRPTSLPIEIEEAYLRSIAYRRCLACSPPATPTRTACCYWYCCWLAMARNRHWPGF